MTGDPASGPAFGVRFVVATLATWRATHLLAAEDGPAGTVARVRARLGTGPLAELADCFQCLSVWVAAPLALFVTRRRTSIVVTWLGLSGAACLLERLTGEAGEAIQAAELAFDAPIEGGQPDGMLWSEAR